MQAVGDRFGHAGVGAAELDPFFFISGGFLFDESADGLGIFEAGDAVAQSLGATSHPGHEGDCLAGIRGKGQGKDTPILIKPPPRKLTLTVEWSRRDETTVIGRILYPEGVRVTFIHYFPWDLKGEYALLADGQVMGHCSG